MFNKSLIISIFILSLLNLVTCKTEIVHTLSPCNNTVNAEVASFYTTNQHEYDIFVSHEELLKLPCQIMIVKVDGMTRSVAHIQLEEYKFSGLHRLLVSQEDVSDGWQVEEEEEVFNIDPLSLNYLMAQEGANRDARNKEFWMNVLNDTKDNFDFSKKQKYNLVLYMMHILGLDNLQSDWINDFYVVLLIKRNPYLNDEFVTELENAVLNYAQPILSYIKGHFTAVLQSKVEDELYQKILTDDEFIKSTVQSIYKALEGHFRNEIGTYGRSSVAKKANEKFSNLSQDDLESFFLNYDTIMDPTLDPFDYTHPVAKENPIDQLINEFGDISIYKIKYFILEQFELVGKKRPRVSEGRVYAQEDTCHLTNMEKVAMVTQANEKLVLKEDRLNSKNFSDLFKGCTKQEDGNTVYFKVDLQPYSENKICEIVYVRKYSDHMNYSSEILVDTYSLYTKTVSCNRLTRGVIEGTNNLII